MHRVAEAGLLSLTPVVSAVIAAGLKAIAGLVLALDGAPIMEPQGEVAVIQVGPLTHQRHVILLEHIDPRRLNVHHSLRETC